MAGSETPVDAPESRARPRRYRGLSVEERRAQRRERLLDAGLELFGTEGYARSSIRAVSAAASLNSRYFYESFSSREDLLFHVYQRAVRDVATAIVRATAAAGTVEGQAREGLRASWTVLTEDRRKARVIVLEVVGVSERLERARRENRHAMADILLRNALSLAGSDVKLRMDPVLNARALIGASMEVLVDWIHGDVEASTEEIVEHLTRMYTAVAEASVARE
ncbi:MAG TPA: TetR/AcrR family transcriptional regulator [Solirubrobacteraceae bacterium]|nr:TetR/AcrR family transcriptional regulator [Solirubrobacteraceae bacterium]